MAQCLSESTLESSIKETHIKLLYFVDNFVKYFEQKLESYLEERTGLTQNSTKSAFLAQNVSSAIGEFFSLGNAAGLVSNFLCKLIYDHKNKAKRATSVFSGGDELRKELVKAGIDIFRCFESQYSEISKVGNWKIEFIKIAIDAVERIMNYVDSSSSLKKGSDTDETSTNEGVRYFIRNFFTKLKSEEAVNSRGSSTGQGHTVSQRHRVSQEHPINSRPDLSHNFITECFLKGDSKGMFGTVWPIRTVNTENQKLKISKIYEEVGLRVPINGIEKYFKRKKTKRAKYGYRLSFEWETRNEEQLKERFDLIDLVIDSSLLHEYILGVNVIEETWEEIYQEINRNDPDKISGHINIVMDLIGNLALEIGNVKNDTVTIMRRLDLLKEHIESMEDNHRGIDDSLREFRKLFDELLSCKRTPEAKTVLFFKNPVTSFTGRVDQLNKLSTIFSEEENSGILISGLGGVGKSELARKFAFECSKSKDFQSIVWINSESKTTLENSFKDIAKGELEIALTKLDLQNIERPRGIDEIVKEVYKYFKNEKLLIIFDNAETFDNIRLFLPSFLPNYVKPKVLITSKNQSWDHTDEITLQLVDLTEFKESEALEYIKNELTGQLIQNLDDKEIEDLASTMQCLPLALRQATSYIIMTDKQMKRRSGQNFGIREYLNKFQNEANSKCLLDYSATDSKRYNKTLYTTCQMTMNSIGAMENGGNAIDLIKNMAYLAPERISVQTIFEGAFQSENRGVFECAELLHDYSLITLKHGDASMHRLVQQVIRSSLIEDNSAEKYLKGVFNSIHKNVDTNELHLPYIWKYGSKNENIIKEFYGRSITSLGYTPLHLLLKNEQCNSAVTLLMNLKVVWPNQIKDVINGKELVEGKTPLHIACEIGSLDAVKCLLEAGAPVKCTKNNGEGVLHSACKGANLDVVKHLIKEGADPKNETKKGVSVLHSACCADSKNLEIIDYLISLGIDINCKDEHGNTPLHYACSYENFVAVQSLCSKGANLSIKNSEGRTPLHLACFSRKFETFDALLESYIKTRTLGEYSPKVSNNQDVLVLNNCIPSIYFKSKYPVSSISKENIRIIEHLLAERADVNSIDEDGYTPLHIACKDGNYAAVERLFEKVADLGNENGTTINLLHCACAGGNIDVIEYLLGKRFNVNSTDKNGNTPLHVACEAGNYAAVEKLISMVDDLFRKNDEGHNLLHCACIGGNMDIVKLLLEKDFRVDWVDKNGNTPLHAACRFGNHAVLEMLYDKIDDSSKTNRNGWTLLHSACQGGNVDVIKFLLNKDDNLPDQNKYGCSPLYYACAGGNPDVINYLLIKKPDLNCATHYGDTPLHAACYNGNFAAVKILCDSGGELNSRNKKGWSLLHAASIGGNTNIIKYLLNENLAIDDNDDMKNTPLHFACQKGHYRAAQILCHKGANLFSQNDHGTTLLHAACIGGNIYIIEYLLTKKLNVNCVDKNGNTPLHAACEAGSYASVEKLGDVCNLFAKNEDGSTLLHSACIGGNASIIDYLLDRNLDMSCVDSSGNTPLHIACKYASLAIVQKVCDLSHNLNHRNNNGWTVLHYACVGGNTDVIEHIINRKLDVNCTDNYGNTPLHVACQFGKYNVVQSLWNKVVDFSTKNISGWTLLHSACIGGNLDIIEYLLNNNFDVYCVSECNETPLHFASEAGNYTVFQKLCEKVDDSFSKHEHLTTLLHAACVGGNLDIVKYLLMKNFDLNAADYDGNSPLHIACKHNKCDIVKLLCDKDTGSLYKNVCGWTPLHYACEVGNTEIIECLLSKHFNVDALDDIGNTPLHIACQNGKIDAVQRLWEEVDDLSRKNEYGCNLLYSACIGGNIDVIQYLISKGFEVDSIDKDGNTLLHAACQYGNFDAVKILWDEIDVFSKNNYGYNLLYSACIGGNIDVIQYLIKKGFEVDSVDKDGNTLLHAACQYGNYNAVKILWNEVDVFRRNKFGHNLLHFTCIGGNVDLIRYLCEIFDVNSVNDKNCTPLHLASHFNKLEAVKYLCENKGNVCFFNNNGQTPKDLATDQEVVDVLKRYEDLQKGTSSSSPF